MQDITVEIVVRKTFQVEVDDDFFEQDFDVVQDFLIETEADAEPDTEAWESSEITDDDEGVSYNY
jgi:DNA-binding protein YbaB